MSKKGFTLIELLVVIAIIALLMGILMPALNKARMLAYRLACGANLGGLGKAMELYASENEDTYPRSGGPRSSWSSSVTITEWDHPHETKAFRTTGVPRATITSCWYLLIRTGGVTIDQFLCKSDQSVEEFKFILERPFLAQKLDQAWDFGGGSHALPSNYVSYAYQLPFDVPNPRDAEGEPDWVSYCITGVTSSGAPVAADRSPYLDELGRDKELGDESNSLQHNGEGQNVLYKGGNVHWRDNPKAGIGGDNIYTYGKAPGFTNGGDPVGISPKKQGGDAALGSKGDNDALLVLDRNY